MRQSKILLYLIMLLGLVMGYLYSSQSDPTAVVPVLNARLELTSLAGLKNVNIDTSILTNPAFSSLRIFGQLPVQPSGGGRDNPFQ
jgi:hypothetical protein